MKKKYLIIGGILLSIFAIILFIYSQMKVESIILDIDYAKSSYFTTVMKPNKDDEILITPSSKIKLTKHINDTKLFNKKIKCLSSNNNIVSIVENDLVVKGFGNVQIHCESILGTKSNIINFTVIEDEV